jgi:hypothetical protein
MLGYHALFEAESMALVCLKAIGTSKSTFLLKPSRAQPENIYYGYKEAKKLGFTKIALGVQIHFKRDCCVAYTLNG